jgi:hypothetical protein
MRKSKWVIDIVVEDGAISSALKWAFRKNPKSEP